MQQGIIIHNSRRGSGFTLIEMLVVIAIISILASFLMPALGRAQLLARSVSCQNQLKNIGHATMTYLNDNDSFFPGVLWMTPSSSTNASKYGSLTPVIDAQGLKDWSQIEDTILTCPVMQSEYPAGNTMTFHYTYSLNAMATSVSDTGARTTSSNRPVRVTNVRKPSQMSVFFDGLPQNQIAGGWYYLTVAYSSTAQQYMRFPHMDAENVVYVDGHVSSVQQVQFIADYFPDITNAFWIGR